MSRPSTALRQRMLQDLQTRWTERRYPRVVPPRRPATRRPLPHSARPLERTSSPRLLPPPQERQEVRLLVARASPTAPSSSSIPTPRPATGRHFSGSTSEGEEDSPTCSRSTRYDRLIAAVRTHHDTDLFLDGLFAGPAAREGLHFQVGDIDSARMLVHVHRGKGAKDRYIPLPSSTLKILRKYWVTHRHPGWLFPALNRIGRGSGNPQRIASAHRPMVRNGVQDAIRRVVVLLGLRKAVSTHTLRLGR